jgi:hypothetical protein
VETKPETNKAGRVLRTNSSGLDASSSCVSLHATSQAKHFLLCTILVFFFFALGSALVQLFFAIVLLAVGFFCVPFWLFQSTNKNFKTITSLSDSTNT